MLGAVVIKGGVADVLEHEAASELNLRLSQMGKLRLREVRDFARSVGELGDTAGLAWPQTCTRVAVAASRVLRPGPAAWNCRCGAAGLPSGTRPSPGRWC